MNISTQNSNSTMDSYCKDSLPFERSKLVGFSNLSDSDLLALILRSGSKDSDVFKLVNGILNLSPIMLDGLSGFMKCSFEDFKSVKGVGDVKASQLMAIAELSKRIRKSSARNRLVLSSPKSLAEYCMEEMRFEKKEEVKALFFDVKCRLLKDMVLSVGTLDMSVISPRDIFAEVINLNAAGFVLLHNHPSGDPSPSFEDIKVSKRIDECASFMNIKFIDHIIIGDNRYYSLREHGCLGGNFE